MNNLTLDARGADPANYMEGVPKKKATLVAFYLPQFHPIPENDLWWGPGFTEWTNVAKARPLFPGHQQPNLPGELGFYDLRLPEARAAQAELARAHGVSAFCYWHYWFGNGKRLLERPFDEVLASGEPDFPFCLAWANETWAGLIHGAKDRVLIEQNYPGTADSEAHFNHLLKAFLDKRYLKIDGKPIFLVYKPRNIPNSKQLISQWQSLARRSGLPGMYFIGIEEADWIPSEFGFDALVLNEPRPMIEHHPQSVVDKVLRFFTGRGLTGLARRFGRPPVYRYEEVIKVGKVGSNFPFMNFPVVVPNWDTTPRSGKYGHVFVGSTPKLFNHHVEDAIQAVADRRPAEQLIFLKSWNEWAEGNYVEPDLRHGRAYLEAIRDAVFVVPA